MISIFNPFNKIAGTKALGFGVVIAMITLAISFFSHSAFDGVLDFHKAPFSSPLPYISFYSISWFCLIVYFGLAGIAFTHTKFRWIDIIGTTLLSRFPLLLIALASFAIPFIDRAQLHDITTLHFTAGFFIGSLLALLCIIWSVVLYYNSFKVSLNMKGAKAVWSFILALLLAEITSLVITRSIHFN